MQSFLPLVVTLLTESVMEHYPPLLAVTADLLNRPYVFLTMDLELEPITKPYTVLTVPSSTLLV